MKQIILDLDDATFDSVETQAKEAGMSLSSLMMGFLNHYTAIKSSEFERLETQESLLYQRLRERGTVFSAASRLQRDDLYDRHP